MNNFGGDWTKIKIEILVEYANAYLTKTRSIKHAVHGLLTNTCYDYCL